MDELQSSDETAFVDADAEAILLRCIESHLKDKTYDDAKVAGWVNGICEDAVYGLIELGKPFKYIINCVVTQNTGQGVHTSISSFCDTVNDGVCVVKWPTEKKTDANTIYCIATVFGLAL